MGRGIALAFALAGSKVVLLDIKQRDPIAEAQLEDDTRAELYANLTMLAELGVLRVERIEPVINRIHFANRHAAPDWLGRLDLVFEGVPETLEAKSEAFEYACRYLPEDALLASTSSTMLSSELAKLVTHPIRFLNAHWLNPAYLIPLVELSPHADTAPQAIRNLIAVLEGIGKTPVVCAARPGYIVPRLQSLIMNEAARMIEEGVATAEDIDKATRYGFGIRYAAMGVVEFIDFGGVDILCYASRYLSSRLESERYACPSIIERKMAENNIGLKSGKGFYDWRSRDPVAYQHQALGYMVDLLRLNAMLPLRDGINM
jgi:3-hydroxybutyryl-CoA dehydrogenase